MYSVISGIEIGSLSIKGLPIFHWKDSFRLEIGKLSKNMSAAEKVLEILIVDVLVNNRDSNFQLGDYYYPI